MSKDQVKKFLEGVTEYPDATMVKIGDQEFPLGSIRALNADERSAFSDGIKRKEAELDSQRKTVVELAQKAQQAYDAAEEARKKAGTPPAPGQTWKDDPWFQPIAKELEARDSKLSEYQKAIDSLTTTVRNAATIWAEDRWERDYGSLDFGKRDKKPTREELIEFATKNNLVDRHKIPSVRAAWEKMSEADRLDDLRKSEFEKGREAGRMETLAARVPQPGVPGAGMPPAPKSGPGSDVLGDLYSEAVKDPELRSLIEQLPQGIM